MATFTGSSLADSIAGSGLADLVLGLGGNDTLSGGLGGDTLDGGTGGDSLDGGEDNDTYIVDSASDRVVDAAGDSDDRVLASITIDLNSGTISGVEHVTLTGTKALNATGNGEDNMLVGNAGTNILDGKGGDDTLTGGAGNDTYRVDEHDDLVRERFGEGIDTVISTASQFTLNPNVENLTLDAAASDGTGNDLANKITGNASDNILEGAAGNDTLTGNDGADDLDGGTGADSMAGGNGNDSYTVDDAGDKVSETSTTGGADTVFSSISYTLGNNLEDLFLLAAGLVGTGNSLANFIIGSTGSETLSGLGGNDNLFGDNDVAGDLLLGGDGNDTLIAGGGADTIVGGAGADVVQFSGFVNGTDVIVGFDALAGGDRLDLDTGSVVTGFTTANVNAFLKATTANGSTTLELDFDGAANGVSFVPFLVLQGVSTDVAGLIENGSLTGFDLGPAAGTGGTTAGETLAGGATSDLINGLGGNDMLTGNAGADTLDGGTGTDTLVGGAGNDLYVIDSASDKIDESGADLDDRILASITIDLNNAAYAGIEHVTLSGTGATKATGNGGANMLIGNSGANVLDGGAGADTLIGGAGNDTYRVDSFDDQIVENSGEGTDTVISTASLYVLGAAVENLTLDVGAHEGTGNDLANVIIGNADSNSLNGEGGNDTLIGNDGSEDLRGGTGADSMVGGNGDDAYFVDDVGDKVSETSANGGTADGVVSSIDYVLGANIEFLELTGSEDLDGTGNTLNNGLEGNTGDNVLSGLAGADSISSGGGADLLLGGDGNDTLYAADFGDTLAAGDDTLVGGAGADSFAFVEGPITGLDRIRDFNVLLGDVLDLTGILVGFSTADVTKFFKTATTAGGNTVLQVDLDGAGNGVAFKDLVVLEGIGTDLDGLIANGSLAPLGLAATPIAGGTAADNKTGTALSDLINGLGGNDTLTGDAGADTLDGGTGGDSLIGGAGNDLYVIDSASDKIDESGGGLDDRILASITIDLTDALYAGIEHVTLSGTGATRATGNDGFNMLIGNSGANVLDGGIGEDTLIGGAGNDTYRVDDTNDQVIENPGEGTDTVISSAGSFELEGGIENLSLDVGAVIGHGNELANKITGNAEANELIGDDGNDTLTGNDGADSLDGGAGADSMTGGNGDDSYDVDDIGDKVTESSAGGGFDSVFSTISYTLGSNLELLDLSGTGPLTGTGNSLNNIIRGGSGDDTLSGLAGNDEISGGGGTGADDLLGGDGNDTLTADGGADLLVGGAGFDRFVFDSSSLNGLDVIADFAAGDLLDLADLLNGYAEDSSNINNFLRAVQSDGSTTIQVDANGAVGGSAFVDLCVLQGVNTTISGLLANGSLVLD